MSKVPEFINAGDVRLFLPTVLRNLSFTDNFRAFLVQDLSIPAITEVAIRNEFQKTIPSGYFIIRHTGEGVIRDGARTWDTNEISLQNIHATEDSIISVIFFML